MYVYTYVTIVSVNDYQSKDSIEKIILINAKLKL